MQNLINRWGVKSKKYKASLIGRGHKLKNVGKTFQGCFKYVTTAISH